MIGFLHTAEVHTATFAGLVDEMAPQSGSTHVVDPALLVDAQTRGGVDAELRVRLRDRLHEAAIGAGIVVCAGAWADFEAGHMDAYLDAIARVVDTVAAPVDVIVLAQASMAAVADRARTPVPILSSPRLAVAAAIAELPTE